MEDLKIVELYLQRNEYAIEATDKKYRRYLTKIAFNILNDNEDTEEGLNDTYLAAWNSIPPHRPSVLRTYLGKLIRRISVDIFRKRTREKRKASQYSISISELSDCIPGGDTPEKAVEETLLSSAISDFLKKQSPEARTVFVCRYYFLDPVKAIAKSHGITEAKVKTLLFRTRKELKAYLEKEGFYRE